MCRYCDFIRGAELSVRRFLSLDKRKLTLLIVVLVLTKVVLAAITPAGDAVVYYLTLDTRSPSPDANNPWGILGNAAVSFWRILPITHNDTFVLINSIGHLLPTSLQLLVLIARMPLVIADLTIGYVLYLFGKQLWPSTKRGELVALLWLANPYATFVTEMYGAVDIIPLMGIMLSIYLVLRNKYLFAGIPVAFGVALKLFPLVTVPAILYAAHTRGAGRVKTLISVAMALLGTAVYFSWSGFPLSAPYNYQDITEFVLGVESYLGYANIYNFIGLATFSVIISYLLLYEYRNAQLANPLISAEVALLGFATFLVFQVEYILWVLPLLILANFTAKRTIPLHVFILVTAFSLGFLETNGYVEQLGLIMSTLKNNWISVLTTSPLVDLVLGPLLHSLLAASMLLTILILATPKQSERS